MKWFRNLSLGERLDGLAAVPAVLMAAASVSSASSGIGSADSHPLGRRPASHRRHPQINRLRRGDAPRDRDATPARRSWGRRPLEARSARSPEDGHVTDLIACSSWS
jgi:hypothetical protein